MSFAPSSRILILGSNRAALNHSSRFLEGEGYTVEVWALSSITVQTIEWWSPALIIFDLLADEQLEQKAWLLMRQLEASHPGTCIVFLVCTVTFVIREYRAYLQEKHIPILFKPLDLKELGRHVRQLLS
jgi:DNA-binding NtrC family response regulator